MGASRGYLIFSDKTQYTACHPQTIILGRNITVALHVGATTMLHRTSQGPSCEEAVVEEREVKEATEAKEAKEEDITSSTNLTTAPRSSPSRRRYITLWVMAVTCQEGGRTPGRGRVD